ncbi:MAG: PBP1A family penicillin-binding protein [Acidobacteria bacterium]|nr:PBP1A family penicillin-binding protein [Acidobacteriota bacterium]
MPQLLIRFLGRVSSRLARLAAGRPVLVAAGVTALALPAWSVALFLAWLTWDIAWTLPGRDDLQGVAKMAQATTIYDADDQPIFTIFKEQRIEVPIDRVSPRLIEAVVAIEDQRFFDHRGVDLVRVAAAALANLRERRAAQGGSTITQQLARQSFLTPDKTIRRKLKEILVASQLEHSFSKDEILEMYLNKVYFGDGFYGVEAASLGYFDKHAAELDVAEAALLAGLIQSPSAYAPTGNRARALARRRVVLNAMHEMGAIDRETLERAREVEPVLRSRFRPDEPFGLYAKEQIRRDLVERFGWERVSQGGLRVYSTIDAGLQQQVERAVEAALVRIESRPAFRHPSRVAVAQPADDQAPDYLQAAVVVLDAATGHVRAMVGGRDFRESRFNRAVQARRQPGSAFKPFVFAAAIESRRFTPASLVTGLDEALLTGDGEWMPEDEHLTTTEMTLRTALRTSSNRAAVRLLQQVGITEAVRQADGFAVGPVPAVPSLALGAGEVTLQSLTTAFAAFANGGLVNRPVLVRRVEDADGALLASADEAPQRAVSAQTAFLVANMLADVVNAGTGYRARQSGFTLPAAGKTGTTNDYKDAWFVGFTPRVVAGVWIGFDQPRTILPGGYAGDLAVPLWAAIMRAATAGDPATWVERPEGVVAAQVCRLSGKLPAAGCGEVEVVSDTGEVNLRSMIYTEYFLRGTVPDETCALHTRRSFWERLAGVFKGQDTPAPVRASDVGVPIVGPPLSPPEAPPPARVEAAEAAVEPEAPPAKKRGFWGRLFGRRGKPDDAGRPSGATAPPPTPTPRPRPQ